MKNQLMKKKHKIICYLDGVFQNFGYILEEPKIFGADFMDEYGNSSWPKLPEKRTILIGECGTKIEINNENNIYLSNYSNPINKIRKNIIYKSLSNLPKKEKDNEQFIYTSMKNEKDKYKLTPIECAYFIFKWISENIENDCYNSIYNIKEYYNSKNNIYISGKGSSLAISFLFKKISNILGIETGIISGYSKLNSYTEGDIPYKTDHFWNYIKIGDSFYLIDSSSGSGYCDGESFINYFNEFYFCPNPESFIHLFFPVLNKWQLLPNIIKLEDFVSKSLILDTFYEYEFKNIYPDVSVLNINEGKANVTLYYMESNNNINKNMMIFCELFYMEKGIPRQLSNSCLITKKQNKALVNIITNDKREYILIILAGPIYSQVFTEFEEIIACKINSTKNSKNPLNFPGITPSYLFSNIEYFEPFYDSLIKGTFINFKIKTNSFNNLYLMIGDKYIRKLEKMNNDIFLAESVYIFGNKVKLFAKIGNNNKDILEYKTINSSNSIIEPSFPLSYFEDENILFSPTTDTLIKGKIYNFKIKSNFSKAIIVFDLINMNRLSKNGLMFSGNFRVNENSNNTFVADFDGKTKKCSIIYEYKNL